MRRKKDFLLLSRLAILLRLLPCLKVLKHESGKFIIISKGRELMGKFKDITGQRFGRLVAIHPTNKRKHKSVVWECQCDCGKVVEINAKSLISGNTKSCGCLQREVRSKNRKKPAKDIMGQRFGRLVAIRLTDKRKNRSAVWECQCDCGKVVEVKAGNLHNGSTKSCGCLAQEIFSQNRKNKAKDISNQRFGRLVAIRPTDKRKYNSVVWECQCDCGKVIEVKATGLINGQTKSCGCLLRDIKYESGKNINMNERFGLIENTSISIIKSKKPRKDSTTGQRGVIYDKRSSKYAVQIGFKKKTYHLGYYNTVEEATKVRKRAEEMLYEPFLKWFEENRENLFSK